jgi:shikimate kinase
MSVGGSDPGSHLAPEKHLVLVGLMGAGKTTVGRSCAARLDRAFVDTDDVVTTLAGMPVPEVFATQGEDAFRALERQVVADVCASPVPLVIACGGGTAVDADNRLRLRTAGVVVWLRAPTEVLAGRVDDGGSRPLLAGDPARALARLGALRKPAYEAAAHCAIDTAALDADAVTHAVLEAYREATAT